MRNKVILFILISIVSVVSQNIPAMLPLKFTQAFVLRNIGTGDPTAPGKIWMEFNSTTNNLTNMRVDWISSHCSQVFPGVSTCRFMDPQDGSWYFLSPQQNLCYQYNNGSFELSRVFYKPEFYTGIKQVDGQQYHHWYNSHAFLPTFYYSEINQTSKPRIFGFTASNMQQLDGIYMDALIPSYQQRFNSTSVFQIPKYCLNQTSTLQKIPKSLEQITLMKAIINIFGINQHYNYQASKKPHLKLAQN